MYNSKCSFYVEYISHTSDNTAWQMKSCHEYHNHELNKKVTKDLKKWFDDKGKKRNTMSEAKWKKLIKSSHVDWKKEFTNSLTYELSAVYSTQLQSINKTEQK